MKAIRIMNTGGPEVLGLAELPVPEPGPNELLVRIARSGVNFADVNLRRDGYPGPVTLPVTPGLEGAGTVVAVGSEVREFRPGDRVAYLALAFGAYAQCQVVDTKFVVRLPDDISFDLGAALMLQGITAHFLVFENKRIDPGVSVLVHAAAGGMGVLLTQWLKRLGATVIGTTSSPSKAAVAREAGADHVILYTEADFVKEALRITGGRGVDYVIDGVGRTTFARNFDAVAERGHVTSYGWASGAPEPIHPQSLIAKSITVSGGNAGSWAATRGELERRTGDVFEGARTGWLKPRIERVLPLEDAREAHELLEGRKTTGKVLLAP